MSEFTEQQEILYAAEEARKKAARERRRSSLSLPTVSDLQDTLSASVNIGSDQVEFEAQGVKINRDGLFIEGTNVSEVHQDDLSVLGELGRGACSVVMQAQHVQTRQLYAIKVFSVFDRDNRAQLLKEVEALWGMECPSLINFVGGYLKDGSIHVVLEFMDRGSLTDLIHGWRDIEYGEDLMAAITIQMLWGLGYLHFEHLVHRDIKPQNVLLNSKGEVKLSDFGLATELEGELGMAQTMVGTIRYMSPERLAGSGYGVTADVWSLGVVLLEMAARRLPFDTTCSQIDLHERLQQDVAADELIKFVPGHSPQFEEVVRGCLQTNPEDRLSPEELLELEWFRPFRRPARKGSDGGGVEGGDDGVVRGTEALYENGGEGTATATTATTGDANGVDRELEGVCRAGKGEEEGEEGVEGDDDGNEQHDLDRATSIVRDYIAKAVEERVDGNGNGIESANGHSAGNPGTGGGRGYTGIGASAMIHTMYSDGDPSDSDTLGGDEPSADQDDDSGDFAGLQKGGPT